MTIEFKKPPLGFSMSKSKASKHMLIVLFAVIVILVFIIAFLSFFLALGFNTTSSNSRLDGKKENICTSKQCVKAANLILQNMDESREPCENFYEFTCGNYFRNNRLREDQSKLDEFSMLRDRVSYLVADLLSESVNQDDILPVANAKRLFASCVDELTIEERGFGVFLNTIKSEFGGWPIIHGVTVRNSSNRPIVKLLIKLAKVGSTLPFEMYVSPNPKNPKQNILRISQTDWFFNKEYLFDEKIMIAYHNLLHSMIQAFNIDGRNITARIDKIFELERKFAFLQLDDEERRNSTYIYTTLKELNKSIPLIEWKEIITGLFSDIENVTITDSEEILIDDFKYLVEASKLYSYLKSTTPIDLENFLIWLYVKDLIPFLPKFFQEIKLDFDKVYEGNSIKPSRSLSCSNFVNNKMEHAVGRLYVSRYFNGTSKTEAVNMTNNLLNAFKTMLNETDWMDEESKQVAIEKVNFIDTKIGYSDDIHNDTYLNEIYKNFNFNESNLLENYIQLEKLIIKYEYNQLRKEQNPKQWISGPAVVNAFYSPTANQICFPAGILQPPFYDSSNPKYLNYGAIGTVIGHEITHGFDDMGRLYDKNGVFSNHDGIGLWSNKTIEMYKQKAECIIDQYNSYKVKQVNKTLNGFNTQGENIADNGGVKQAFRAYKHWLRESKSKEMSLPGLEKFTDEQMFFITYGQLWCGKSRDQAMIHTILNDPHSPGEFRIIGATSNMNEFSEAFKCKKDQRNNPVKKCSVW